MSLLAEWGLFFWDLGRRLLGALPRAWERFQFRRFWKAAAGAGDLVVVIDSYEDPRPRVGNRYIKNFPNRTPSQIQLVGASIIYGTFTPEEASLVGALFRRFRENGPQVVVDTDIEKQSKGSFICFGSADSNIKTFDFQGAFGSRFYEWTIDPATGVRAFKMKDVLYSIAQNPDRDHAVLLKARNPFDEDAVVVICAGLSEWGTLAAVKYLVTRWKSLLSQFGKRDFCLMLKVVPGQPEAVQVVDTVTA